MSKISEEIKKLLVDYPDDVDISGAVDDSCIASAEKYLNVKFPPSYKEFLREFGTLGMPNEIYGITGSDFQNSGIPNGIWYTAIQRKDISLPHNLILVREDDGVACYCIDTSKTDEHSESPIIVWDVPSSKIVMQKGNNFSEFLLNCIQDFREMMEIDDT
jgi:antitoxin YobK